MSRPEVRICRVWSAPVIKQLVPCSTSSAVVGRARARLFPPDRGVQCSFSQEKGTRPQDCLSDAGRPSERSKLADDLGRDALKVNPLDHNGTGRDLV
jgi:hypothetical protein